jgi:hypothetical protein
MKLQLWRVHPSLAKEYAEVERSLDDSSRLHSHYTRAIMEIDLLDFVSDGREKLVADGWSLKKVKPLYNTDTPEIPPYFMDSAAFNAAVTAGMIATV